MVAILGILVTIILAVIWYLFLLILLVVLSVIQARQKRLRRPKPLKPLKPIVKTLPAPKPAVTTAAPSYIRRWGPSRKHSVAAEKAKWEKDFSRLLPPPGATAPERDREFTPPSAPPPAPTPDQVFTGLRKRLSNLA